MRCRTASRLILRSFDAPPDPGTKERLDAHAAVCPACRALRKRAELIRTRLAGAVPPEPRPYFVERLRAKIDENLRPEPVPVWIRWSARAVPVSLLLIAFFAGAIVFLSPAVDEEMSPPEALLLQNANPLSETITLFDEKAENKSLNVIFAVNERSSFRRYGP